MMHLSQLLLIQIWEVGWNHPWWQLGYKQQYHGAALEALNTHEMELTSNAIICKVFESFICCGWTYQPTMMGLGIIRGRQNCPILQSLVHCLLPWPHFLLHCSLTTLSPYSLGTFNKLGALPWYLPSVSHLSPFSNIDTEASLKIISSFQIPGREPHEERFIWIYYLLNKQLTMALDEMDSTIIVAGRWRQHAKSRGPSPGNCRGGWGMRGSGGCPLRQRWRPLTRIGN